MAEIYYLRPKDGISAEKSAELADNHGASNAERCSIAISHVQLATILFRETTSIGGSLSPRVTALAKRFHLAAGGDLSSVSVNSTNSTNPAFAKVAAQKASNLSEDISGGATVPGQPDAITIDAVQSGKVRVRSNGVGSSSAAGRILAQFVGVPDTALHARQERNRQATFSFKDVASLETTINGLILANLMMVQNWSERGGRPPLHLRYQANESFGSIAHVNSDRATALRGIAVSMETTKSGSTPWVRMYIAITPPAKR